MKPVIYADTLFLFNFLMNSIILIITRRLIRSHAGIWRLAAAAALGAAYSVLMFFPRFGIFYTWFLKVIILLGIEYLAFGGRDFKRAAKNFLIFLLINISVGGGLLALIFYTDFGTTLGSVVSGGGVYINLSPFILIFGIAGTYVLLGVYQKMSRRKLFEESLIKRVRIDYKNKSAEAEVFIDTGCRLCDPLNDSPSMVVDYGLIKWILSDRERKIVENNEKNIIDAFENGMRVLPYSTLGGDNMIFGIIADKVSGENFSKDKVTVGISVGRSLGHGGIINPELIADNYIQNSLLEVGK